MKSSWIPALLLLASPSHATEVFSHDSGRIRWEAEVTGESFALRETKDGASMASEFVCPLGPAVRASVVRTGSDAGKVCLVFSRDKCARNEGGAAADPLARAAAVSTFKCLDFATAEHATTLAALINAGPRTYSRPQRSAAPAGARGSGAVARSPGAPGSPGSRPVAGRAAADAGLSDP
jgi:hypothetical protein